MKELPATVTSKGQVTIPVEVRRLLKIGRQDKVNFTIDDEGNVKLTVPRYPTIESLRGVAGSLHEKLSWEQTLQIAYEDRFAQKDLSAE